MKKQVKKYACPFCSVKFNTRVQVRTHIHLRHVKFDFDRVMRRKSVQISNRYLISRKDK